MLHFPRLTTCRLQVQQRELTIGQSIAIAGFPEGAEEAANTLMLRHCCEQTNLDPLYWTIQERALGVGQYLMAVNTEQPDFPIGDSARFSQYIHGDIDIDPATVAKPLYVGEVEGDQWAVNHLYGYMLEAVERVHGLVALPSGDPLTPRQHWIFGCMAAQMVRVKGDGDSQNFEVIEQRPAVEIAGQYDDWLMARMRVFVAMPDNAFAAMYMLYRCGKTALDHLFRWEFSIEGKPVFLPSEQAQEGADAVLPPATFHADSVISPTARELGGKHEPAGT